MDHTENVLSAFFACDDSIDSKIVNLCQEEEDIHFVQETSQSLWELCNFGEHDNKTSCANLQSGRGLKRKAEDITEAGTSSAAAGSSKNNDDKTLCELCNIWVRRTYFANHLKSNLHKNKVIAINCHTLNNVSLINSAFGSRIRTYRITSESEDKFETPEVFLEAQRDKIAYLVKKCLDELIIINVNFIVHAEFIQETKDIKNTFDFQSTNYNFCYGDEFDPLLKKVKDNISTRMSEFEKKDSGWSLQKILYLDMNVNKFNPLKGSSYLDLPNDIKCKKAVINVKNNDHECLKWALLSAMYPVLKNSDRVASYIKHQNKLNFGNICFPVKLQDINKVENLNNISINVFGLDYNSTTKSNSIIGPLYFTKSRKEQHINLLYINNDTTGHYCYIKNLSRLVNKQITGRNDAIHICDGCLLHFPSAQKLYDHQRHDCAHIVTELPNRDKTVKDWFNEIQSTDKILFNQFHRKLKLPFVIYADFESFLKPINTCDQDPTNAFTNNVHEHKVYSYGYYVKCSFDDKLSKYYTYTGPDCARHFMESISSSIADIQKRICFRKSPVSISLADKEKCSESKICFICSRDLGLDIVEHFEWSTGQFKGMAHFVFHRAKRIRDETGDSITAQLDDFKEAMKNMISGMLSEQGKEIHKVSTTLETIQQSNHNIETSISFLAEQNEEFRNKITQLEIQQKEDRKYITILENKIEDILTVNRKTNFEIKNVPKKNNETKEDLLDMVSCLGQSIGCKIENKDVKDIYRVRGKKIEQKNTPIIVETNSTFLKTEFLKMGKAFNVKHKAKLCAKHLGYKTQEDTPIFLSEHLTAKGSRLHFLARDLAKSKSYKFCWTAYGKVYVRKNEGAPIVMIKSEEQIHQLLQQKEK